MGSPAKYLLFNIIGKLLFLHILSELTGHFRNNISHQAFVKRAYRVVERAGCFAEFSFNGFINFQEADITGRLIQGKATGRTTVAPQVTFLYQALQILATWCREEPILSAICVTFRWSCAPAINTMLWMAIDAASEIVMTFDIPVIRYLNAQIS